MSTSRRENQIEKTYARFKIMAHKNFHDFTNLSENNIN